MTSNVATDAIVRTSVGEATLFWVVATVAVLGAIGVVGARKAVYSAMFLATTMIALAVFYIAQGALFLGIVQVVVYAGAVMMLFLFVLMLIGVDSSESLVETIRGQRVAAIVVGVGFGIVLIAGIGDVAGASSIDRAPDITTQDNVRALAALIFTRYLWAFELTSGLLISAALGAMVLAHRQRAKRTTQRDLAVQRFRPGGHPTTLPNPGVYAHHNAVDVAAMLPDGAPALRSVSDALRPRIVGTAQDGKMSSARTHLQLVVPLPDVGAGWIDDWTDAPDQSARHEP